MIKENALLNRILSFSLGPIGLAALSLLSVPITAWIFPPEVVGKMNFVIMFSSFCLLVLSLGLDQAYVRFYYDEIDSPRLLTHTFAPGFILISIVMSVVVLLFPWSQVWFGVEGLVSILLVASYAILLFIHRSSSVILRMKNKGWLFSLTQISIKLITVLILLYYFYHLSEKKIIWLLLAQFCGVLFAVVVSLIVTREEWLLAIKVKFNKSFQVELLKFSLPLVISGLSFWCMTSLDRVFIKHYLGFDSLGIYSVVISFSGVVLILQSVFSTVWAPMVYEWAAKGQGLENVDTVTRWMTLAIGGIFTLAGLFSWLIPYILPTEYESVEFLLVACVAYPLFYTLSEVTVVGINLAKKTKHIMIGSIVALLINISLNYILVPLYGLKGAASATAISFWCFLVMRTELSCHFWKKLPRLPIYLVSTCCLVLSLMHLFFAKLFFTEFITLWIVFGLALLAKGFIYFIDQKTLLMVDK
ncbi:Lipopolysaccharide biosynthesis protein [Vibrio chagasii]|nr:Lipopolysaccharide biosynthesis protein [Vibrio chagasii]CAH6896119.1 Lipopolysaccharide biosynthesis protein [Vibrio chagasii]CAH6971683.1 Lipopolysaccharide biosynthesis protein [Vibrio chagasii]CAH6981562.1 Lipopolysaccharide biosynthesis protein [Vibrio chagasii]CAH6993845.1 Lipopolysaccharide biosynthesis protein [Vibrio chagasii]